MVVPVVDLSLRAGSVALRGVGFRRRWVSTSSGRMHVLRAPGWGSGPPVVFLHGITAASVQYAPNLIAARRWSSEVIAPDLPHHGRSDRMTRIDADALISATLEGLAAALTEPALVYGNSMGGFAALHFALAYPHLVAGLALSSPGGAACSENQLWEIVGPFQTADASCVDDLLADIFFRPPSLGVLSRTVALDRVALATELLADLRPDHLFAPEQLKRLGMPILLHWGLEDRLLPRRHLTWFREHLPEHQFIETARCGHVPSLERPWVLNQLLAAFSRDLARR